MHYYYGSEIYVQNLINPSHYDSGCKAYYSLVYLLITTLLPSFLCSLSNVLTMFFCSKCILTKYLV